MILILQNTEVTLKATCSATETTPDQCSIANSECTDDGTGTSTDKCLCESTHHETGGACVLSKIRKRNIC